MITAPLTVLGQMTKLPDDANSERIPEFIRTDTVKLKDVRDGRIMHIQKFKTVFSPEKGKYVYTGLIVCYWQEGKEYKRDIFHEDDLVLVPKIGY